MVTYISLFCEYRYRWVFVLILSVYLFLFHLKTSHLTPLRLYVFPPAVTQLFRINPSKHDQSGREVVGKVIGIAFTFLGIIFLLLGITRYFHSQHTMTLGKFPASRGMVALGAGLTLVILAGCMIVLLVMEKNSVWGEASFWYEGKKQFTGLWCVWERMGERTTYSWLSYRINFCEMPLLRSHTMFFSKSGEIALEQSRFVDKKLVIDCEGIYGYCMIIHE